jgi:hypothetical protein
MRLGGSLALVVVVCALVSLAAPAASFAAVPRDRSDPCATAGRDSCGTTGVGFYKIYRYGVRWFGDFRDVITSETHSFCLDLGFWYGSPAYRYRPTSAALLRNKDGAAVSAEKQARMAYAIWEYGRSRRPRRQAAVMLYVHALMGDGRPGELNPAALGPPLVALYRRIAGAATRYRGPYQIDARFADTLRVGQETTATIRVLSAEGNALRYVRLTLSADGAEVPYRHVRTDGSGLVVVALTPMAVSVRLRVATEPLASSRPRVFVPTSAAAADNGQRLAAPSSERVSTSVSRRARPLMVATASSEIVRPGSPIFDRIRVEGLSGATGRVEVELFGPSASRQTISCTRRPYWRGRLTVAGDTEVRSPPVEVTQAGFYAYRVHLVGTATIPGSTTDCALASETLLAAPRIVAGGGDLTEGVRAPSVGGRTPVRVRIPSLGISTLVVPSGIDVAHGVLGLPSRIERAGWWRDGAAPGGRSGAILIAGHVDSASAGAGAFFKLHRARAGDLVRVTTADKGTFTYRVVSVRMYHKPVLPTSVYSRNGPPRLVLVTCGGQFDPAGRHYEDNVVLTAIPT